MMFAALLTTAESFCRHLEILGELAPARELGSFTGLAFPPVRTEMVRPKPSDPWPGWDADNAWKEREGA